MKTKIILHGKLAKMYAKELEFANIHKPSDAVAAIETRFPGFRKEIINDSKNGAHYEMLCDDENKSLDQLNQVQTIKVIDIVPCIIGKLPLVLVGFGLGAFAVASLTGWALAFTLTLAVGLIVAGITYMMTPIPENEPDESSISTTIRNSSFLFSNPQNVSAQGRPIPITYGRLRVGSFVISSVISNYDLSSATYRQSSLENSSRSDALVKIQSSFGSSVANYFRGY